MKTWKSFHPFDEHTQHATNQQHLLAQLIGLVGKSYLPEEADFGHAALFYHQNLGALTTKQIQGNKTFSIAFSLKDLRLLILDASSNPLDELLMDGKKAVDAFDWIKSKLNEFGFNPEKLQNTFNETDPAKFKGIENTISIDSSALKQNARYRSNANLILQQYTSRFKHASAVRIWPHHFDSATYIPLQFNEKNEETHSIGLGFSIPDATVNEPYFYINIWSAEGSITINSPEKLKGHGEWVQEGWQGAILRLSLILEKETAEKQWKRINRFFESGILTILNSF